MKVLLIVTNLFIFEEELSALDSINRDDKEIYFCANPDYCDEKASLNIRYFVNKYYPNFIETSLEYYTVRTPIVFDYVLTTSFIQERVHNFLTLDNWKNLEVVEDGSYDYFSKEPRQHKGQLRGSNLWVWKPTLVVDKKVFSRIHKVYFNEEFRGYVKDYFKDDLSTIYDNQNVSTIIYTSPLTDDFRYSEFRDIIVKFLENNKEKYGTNIFLKKHPRDKDIYKSDNLKFHVISRFIPSQFITDSLPKNIQKLYLFPSTQALYDDNTELNTLIVFKDLYTNNETYKSSIDNMKCLFGDNIIEL